jgi:hypothetical protein
MYPPHPVLTFRNCKISEARETKKSANISTHTNHEYLASVNIVIRLPHFRNNKKNINVMNTPIQADAILKWRDETSSVDVMNEPSAPAKIERLKTKPSCMMKDDKYVCELAQSIPMTGWHEYSKLKIFALVPSPLTTSHTCLKLKHFVKHVSSSFRRKQNMNMKTSLKKKTTEKSPIHISALPGFVRKKTSSV